MFFNFYLIIQTFLHNTEKGLKVKGNPMRQPPNVENPLLILRKAIDKITIDDNRDPRGPDSRSDPLN